MKKIYTLPFFALLFLPFCGSRKEDPQTLSISRAEITLAVRLDVLRKACERKLSALEAQVYAPAEKTPHAPNLEAVRASDAVHQ